MACIGNMAMAFQNQAHMGRIHGISSHDTVLEAEFHCSGICQKREMKLLLVQLQEMTVFKTQPAGQGLKMDCMFSGSDRQFSAAVGKNDFVTGSTERGGCLAHLVSDDLENWEQLDPFLIPGFTDQPECTNYFEWNGWYYLLFSNYGTARYQYSRNPFGPWIYPENDIIDGLLYRVPKTADFHGRRIACGFLCIHTAGESYAGNLVFRELCQNPDGTLGTCQVEETLPAIGGKMEELTLDASAGGYRCGTFAGRGKRIKVRINREGQGGIYGLTLRKGDRTAYEIRFDPVRRTMGIFPANSCLYYCPTKRMLDGVKDLEDGVFLTLVIHEDIWDICINGSRTLVCRMEEDWKGIRQIEGFVKDCRAVFKMEY